MRFYTEEDVSEFESIHLIYIQTELADHVFSIALNRPEKRNAFTPTMAEEIAFALAFAHYHSQIRCVILKANGSVFCAGADLNAFHDPTADQKNPELPLPKEEIKLGDIFRELHKPCIAQVEGSVFAGGFLLICGATFVVSSIDATFSLPEVKRGIWPMQVMASLSRIISPRKTLEMAITGQAYSAEEALVIGLVTRIVEKEAVADEVRKLAAQICENAPFAIQLGMQVFEELATIAESKHHAYLKDQLDLLLRSEDAREGSQAFKEKRKPVWKGK
jgi:methylglutaconyl-CoA hydratase